MAAVTLGLLGGFDLAVDGEAVTIAGRKDRLLLAYLALRPGQRHPREALYSLLWGERGEEQARGSLRQSLAALREAFRPFGLDPIAAGREFVTATPGMIATDAAALEAACGGGPLTVGILQSGGRTLLAALDAKDSPIADWLTAERQRMDSLSVKLLERAVTSGEHAEAAEQLALRLLGLDPLLETVHRALMRLLSRRGARAEALKAYNTCKTVLRKELNIAPSLETEQLYRDLVTASPGQEPQVPRATAERPAIAIMPFEAIGGDTALTALGEALAEEVTGGLGRFRQFDIIDRNSAAAIARQNADIAEIGRLLGVGLIARGSIMRLGGRVRLTVSLIEAPHRRQLWSEVFDRPAEEVLALPDDIARAVVATLHARVETSLLEQSRRKPKLDAYECVLKGIKHLRMVGHEHNLEAVRCFEEAIALDPGYALAQAYRAYAEVVLHNYEAAPPGVLAWAREKGEQAVALEPDCARCRWLLGMTYSALRDFESERRQLERSLALNPYDANVVTSYGLNFAAHGQPDIGVKFIREAMRLNPYHPTWYWIDLGTVLYLSRRYSDALEAYRQVPNPRVWVLSRMAACHGQLGQTEDAASVVKELLRQQPDYTLSNRRIGYGPDEEIALFLEGLRKAGLPE